MKTSKIDLMINNKEIPVVVYNNITEGYSIQRENTNIKIINENIQEKFYNYIKKIIIRLDNSLKHCDTSIFYNNLKSLVIVKKYSKLFKNNDTAAYLHRKNIIELYNKNFGSDLSHEILHMATTKKISKDLILSGFTITDFSMSIIVGVFIDEGYTEYINSKYFNADLEAYEINVSFVKLLEKIIGEKLMEQMYFKADLKGLINELMKYNSNKKEVYDFILNTDTIYQYLYSFFPYLNIIKLNKAIIEVNAFLIKTYYAKLLKNNLKHEDIINKMNAFIAELNNIDIKNRSNSSYMCDANEYFDNFIKQKKLNL